MALPAVTSREMRLIDRAAITEYKIPGLILMEHAGLAVARTTRRLIHKSKKKNIVIVAGKGNNAGDGFVAARWLFHFGYRVTLLTLVAPSNYDGNVRTNYVISKRIGVREKAWRLTTSRQQRKIFKSAAVVVDAIFGTGFHGPMEKRFIEVIRCMNENAGKIVSIDVPSGLSDQKQQPLSCVRADVTVTMGFPKKNLQRKSSKKYAGRVVVADIGIPRMIIKRHMRTV